MADWFQEYYPSIRGFVSKRVDDEGTAEELTNDIMLAAYNSLPNFNHQCSEFSFICAIAKHRIIDYYRKKKLKTILFSANPLFEEIADEAINPERDVLKNELKEEIEKTLKDLGEGSQALLRLKYIDGLRTSKIATLLKISIKAVESRLIRARKQFQKSWEYDQKKAKESVEINPAHRR